MAYIGKTPTVGNFQVCDAISVVNGQAAYTLQVGGTNVAPESANHMLVSLNGILQKPGSSFTISSSTMTFASNLATGDVIDFVQILGNVLDIGQPSDATVTTAKLSGNLVTPGTLDINGNELILDADADTSITADTDDQIDFKTGGTDRVKIDSSGNVLVSGDTYDADAQDLTVGMAAIGEDGRILVHSVGQPLELARTAGDTNGRAAIQFWREGNLVGSIETDGSSTTYNTSSDYRLKENVNYDFDATTRLKQLKPARFNFIADDTTTIDGFLAHEVSSVVPEAISGTKDAVQVWENGENLPEGVSVGDNKLDENGNTIPKYQGIDQSKLVPLLVKTIQELEARITTLETKVQTLENNKP
jgi:hypothetical protein